MVDLNDIKFVDGTNKENKNINLSIENLFSEEDKNNIGINNEDYKDEKAYYSLETLKKLKIMNINIIMKQLKISIKL